MGKWFIRGIGREGVEGGERNRESESDKEMDRKRVGALVTQSVSQSVS